MVFWILVCSAAAAGDPLRLVKTLLLLLWRSYLTLCVCRGQLPHLLSVGLHFPWLSIVAASLRAPTRLLGHSIDPRLSPPPAAQEEKKRGKEAAKEAAKADKEAGK